jgi:TetR/AcrR family transcriptional regulator, transcriptional repressor for nem operon
VVTRGLATKARIVRDAAPVFNVRGFSGTSMADLLLATGLQKGGLYNHFGSKEQLAVAAFDYATDLIAERFDRALADKDHAVDRLLAIVGVIRSFADSPVVTGGCPVLNTAIESDDLFPGLRERAQRAMTHWQRRIGGTVKRGVAAGELRPDSDPFMVATVITATLEGAVMLAKLYGDTAHMDRAATHVETYIRSLAVGQEPDFPEDRR